MLWCGYAGSSLEVKIEIDSNDAMEIKTEADSNDMFESPRYDDKPSSGMFRVNLHMFAVSDAVFSTFICLCVTCTQFTLLVSCCCSVYDSLHGSAELL